MIKNKIIDKVALVVVSCDNYSDLWEGFFFFYKKYWKKNLLKSYFVTNNKNIGDSAFEVIKTGTDISWSKNLKIALNQITSYKYVILTEHIPEGEFIPNKEIISGQGTRLKKHSGLNLLEPPFNFKVINEKELSSVNLNGVKGLFVTTQYQMF